MRLPRGSCERCSRPAAGTAHDRRAARFHGREDPRHEQRATVTCSCCGLDGDPATLAGLQCHDDVKICPDCIAWRGQRTGSGRRIGGWNGIDAGRIYGSSAALLSAVGSVEPTSVRPLHRRTPQHTTRRIRPGCRASRLTRATLVLRIIHVSRHDTDGQQTGGALRSTWVAHVSVTTKEPVLTDPLLPGLSRRADRI